MLDYVHGIGQQKYDAPHGILASCTEINPSSHHPLLDISHVGHQAADPGKHAPCIVPKNLPQPTSLPVSSLPFSTPLMNRDVFACFFMELTSLQKI
jgi:hypothetical protein